MSSKQDNTNLYRVLERGDRKIEGGHDSAIILVGLTRAGKSTIFNWILGKHLVGVGDEVDAHYQNVVEDDKEVAQLGDTYTSVTLCPNIVEFDKNKKISLIDMAGYKDKRDFIGVLGVSYFLKAVFEKIKKVKFIIVLGQDKLMQKSGDGIISTFIGFLNMFNLQNMTPKIKEQFYQSITVCISRSQNPKKHQGYLKRITTQLKDPKLIAQKKEQLMSLIEYIMSEDRIESFEAATANTNAPKCQIIQSSTDRGWNFFNIGAAELSINKQLISLPFKKDYEELKQDQKKMVDSVIAARVKSYIEFSKILNTLIRSIQQNWANCIDKWTFQNQFELNLTNFQHLFERVKQFLEENDFYNSEQLIVPQIKLDYGNTLNLVKSIKKILNIYTITDQIGDQQESFINNMIAYTGQFERLIKCIQSFANSQEQERLLLRLSFIIKRGFRQFSKLYQINPNAIHDVSQKMKDNCNLIFEEKRKQFIQRFIMRIDNKLMRKIFTKIDDLIQYQDFFNSYQNDFRRQYKQFYFFSEHRWNIEITKGALYINENKKKKAVRCYIRAFKSVCEIADQVNKSNKSQDQIQVELNQFYMKKLSLISLIISLLIALNDIPEAKSYALNLSVHTKNIYQACQIYQLIIEESSDIIFKLEKIGEFADYCLDWGRYEKATILLQKKMSLEKENFEEYMNTIKKLTIVASQQKAHLQRYHQNLENWTRLPQQDYQLNSYLQELELIVPDQ